MLGLKHAVRHGGALRLESWDMPGTSVRSVLRSGMQEDRVERGDRCAATCGHGIYSA